MKSQAEGTTTVSAEPATGRVGFIRVKGSGDLLPGRSAKGESGAAAKATAYVTQHAAAFGARAGELTQAGVQSSKTGWTVDFEQSYKGVPVFGAMLRAHVDSQGDLVSVNGYAAPGLDLSVNPRLSAEAAAERAVATVREEPPGENGAADTTGIKAVATDLVVYRIGATRGVEGKATLAYTVEVSNERNVRDVVFVDATHGKLLNRYSMVHEALDRRLYEADAQRNLTLVWQEGDPLLPDPAATVNPDQDSMVKSSGEAYWLFRNAFGRDSYDGEGEPMNIVNNDPAIQCPNANWNGVTTNYCNGVSSDDVVAHEWGHAYTEYTSGLIYQWQSGALNESYSDIWGETLDLVNGRLDEDEGDITTPRTVDQCSTSTRGDITMTIDAPASIAGPCADAAPAAFGPVFSPGGVTATVVVAVDPDEGADYTTTDACSPFTNAGAVSGNFAYADRGGCTFATKAANAEAAGATGIVVGDNAAGRLPLQMSGDADIYGAMVRQEDGTKIKSATEPVTVTIKDAGTTPKEESLRWLVGEDSSAFGGAIRDMWNPTCYGDPGKVTDAEYHCDTSDAGGVHSNSGVPNRTFTLLTDGGTYNEVAVSGIGIDKAAAIHWRAQSEYLTPVSDFVDHADALEASCADLVGTTVTKLTTTPDASPVAAGQVTAGDCAQVAAATAATELRTPPEQCNFQPMFDPNTPSLCGDGLSTKTIWSEDFEDGLAGWATSQEVVYEDGFGAPWESVSDAPGTNATKVAYGPAPDRGDCQAGENDFSSRDSITSTTIELPGAGHRFPKLSFDHYVATESGYDGGNVKISVNGRDFAPIPREAYLFNAPTTLTSEATNTSPLAGEPGFTGTDGGELTGTWGTSIVDLAAAGAKAGDLIKLRFDIGRDGCGGLDGWYVDNVEISSCLVATDVEATHSPSPVVEGKASKITVEVSRDGTSGTAPTGRVELTDEDGEVIGNKALRDGKVTFDVPKNLPVGNHTFTASYLGSGQFAPGTDEVRVTVKAKAKAGSTTRATVKPKSQRPRQDFKVTVNVKSSAVKNVSGKVVLRVKGAKVGQGTLRNGKVVITVRRNFKPGTYTLVAAYQGSKAVKASRVTVKFTVRKR
ncbi:M4 family metallopeptidase [Nocardioides jishulii]|nr:M4 family metallopeptidase [Nocardioides jishulii]QCX27769.1 hypothetical protein FCL41_09745 [Nocardioides jishulii]